MVGAIYCLDPVDDREVQEINIAMYRLQPNETYRLVEGSYYELKFDQEMDSFSCGNISLQPSERFTVRQGDVVGFCEESDTVWYHENRDSSLLRWDASGCSESQISFSKTTVRQERELLLAALISKKWQYTWCSLYFVGFSQARRIQGVKKERKVCISISNPIFDIVKFP